MYSNFNLGVFNTAFGFIHCTPPVQFKLVLRMILRCYAYVENLFEFTPIYTNNILFAINSMEIPRYPIDKSSRCDYCAIANISV